MEHEHGHHSQQQQQQQQLAMSHHLLPSHLAQAMQHPGLPQLQQQQQQQQSSDGTPQDVLAAARKNLQVLIDGGFSRDLLHQWVDENSQALLGLPTPMFSVPSQQQLPSNQQALSQPPQQSQSLQHSPQSHTPPQVPQSTPPQQLSPQEPLGPPPPPPPQCPPPPIPTMATKQPSSSPTPAIDVSHHQNTIPEHSATQWSPPHSTNMPSNIPELDAGIFVPPSAPFAHRPRISVSSTSSGSSGHASIWSNSSAHTAMSWQSGGTGFKSHLTSPTSPPTGMPLMNGAHGAATSKTNVYWCTSCETSFKRKYDWKRHEDEFHERWRKYPCPEPGCNRSFWGSNSFNQHHKTCHGCTTCPHAEKVVRFLRKRKYWACGFCSALHPARERHVEHVARHFESGLTKGDWMHSRVVYGLLHQPLIHEAWDALVNSKQAEYGGRRPQFSWHPSKTGRAQGFMENENTGQLQDLLEFFTGDESQAQFIVCHAYELSDIVLTTGPAPSPQFGDATMAPSVFSQDPRMSYASLSSQGSTPTPQQQQQHQQTHSQPSLMQQSPDSNSQHSYPSAFAPPMFMPSQPFAPPAVPRAGSDVSSHSPLTASHSPLTVSPSPGIKRELPPAPAHESGDTLMDFDFSPASVTFDDWESLTGTFRDDSSQHMQPQPQTQQAGWSMTPMFHDPRVTS